MTPDPKPTRRKVATPGEWVDLRFEKMGTCRICGSYGIGNVGRLRVSLHHLVARSLGGDDVAQNLVPLCGDGTRGCHGDIEARRPVALARLRAELRPEEERYVLDKKGADWLERYYPRWEAA